MMKDITDEKYEKIAVQIFNAQDAQKVSAYKLKMIMDYLKLFTKTSVLIERLLDAGYIEEDILSKPEEYMYELTSKGRESVNIGRDLDRLIYDVDLIFGNKDRIVSILKLD
jgi:hypothetical protein